MILSLCAAGTAMEGSCKILLPLAWWHPIVHTLSLVALQIRLQRSSDHPQCPCRWNFLCGFLLVSVRWQECRQPSQGRRQRARQRRRQVWNSVVRQSHPPAPPLPHLLLPLSRLDIETNPSSGCGWGANKATNCEFIKEMINEGHALGRAVGVYSSPYEWSTVAGNCNIRGSYSDVPLWYAVSASCHPHSPPCHPVHALCLLQHYDNSKSFNDYSSFAFGGWTKPSVRTGVPLVTPTLYALEQPTVCLHRTPSSQIKQYTDSLRICGGAFDGDWY